MQARSFFLAFFSTFSKVYYSLSWNAGASACIQVILSHQPHIIINFKKQLLMKQKKMLALTLSQLEQLYRHELPELVDIAIRSEHATTFKTRLSEYIAAHPEVESEAGKQIRLLIEFDGQEVHELSTGTQLTISTLSLLHAFLTRQWEEEMETDVFIDLFQQFRRLQYKPQINLCRLIKSKCNNFDFVNTNRFVFFYFIPSTLKHSLNGI